MEIMFEKQAVVDCLTNTAKYYNMPNADEWTKGIHYGLRTVKNNDESLLCI